MTLAPVLARPAGRTLLACSLAALLLAGCGGSDGAASDTESSAEVSVSAGVLSKADFITRADAICKAGNDALDAALNTQITADSTEDDVVALITTVAVPNLQAQHDQIAALGAPAGDEDTIGSLLDGLQSAIDKVEADPRSMMQDTGAGPFDDVNAQAQEYGLIECGSDA